MNGLAPARILPMLALRPRTVFLLLAAVVALVWMAVGIPAWHIQPFRPQSGDGMAWSYALRSRGPLLTAVGVVAAAALVGLGWRATSRGLSASASSPCWPWRWFRRGSRARTTSSGCSRRWWAAQYAAVADAGFLADAEMVMGVQVGDDAVAFPVRQLAYHHVVNTEVADEPVVATY